MSAPSLKNSLVASSIFLLSSLHVTAQQTFSFLPSAASATFPACGLSCQLLLEAQSACVPPQAGVSNVNTYVSCFCQSSLITGLTYSASMCPGCTAPTDQQLLSTWYKNYCAGGYTSTLTDIATATMSTTKSTSSSSTTTGATTASATNTNSASQAGSSLSNSVSSGHKSWFSTHWQWVLMLIILAIGFSALAAGAIWLKKRLDAKQPNLYHGDDDREEGNASGGSGGSGGGVAGPAAGFFAGSLRNLSRSNVNSARASTTNSGSTNDIVASSKGPRVQQQPDMSTTSFSNRHSSTLRNSVSSSQMNNAIQNNHQMWGPNQARDIDGIAPVEEPVFRNSMASSAAAAAFEGAAAGEIGVARSTDDNSHTDLSSAAAGGGRATPRNMNRLSGQSASSSNLHQKQQMQQPHRVLQRPKSANSAASPVSAVSPIS